MIILLKTLNNFGTEFNNNYYAYNFTKYILLINEHL